MFEYLESDIDEQIVLRNAKHKLYDMFKINPRQATYYKGTFPGAEQTNAPLTFILHDIAHCIDFILIGQRERLYLDNFGFDKCEYNDKFRDSWTKLETRVVYYSDVLQKHLGTKMEESIEYQLRQLSNDMPDAHFTSLSRIKEEYKRVEAVTNNEDIISLFYNLKSYLPNQ